MKCVLLKKFLSILYFLTVLRKAGKGVNKWIMVDA